MNVSEIAWNILSAIGFYLAMIYLLFYGSFFIGALIFSLYRQYRDRK